MKFELNTDLEAIELAKNFKSVKINGKYFCLKLDQTGKSLSQSNIL